MRFSTDGRLSTDAKISIVLTIGNALGAIPVFFFFSVIEEPFSLGNSEAEVGIDRSQIVFFFFFLTFAIAVVIWAIFASKLDKPINDYLKHKV